MLLILPEKIFILEIFRPPYSVIQFGSLCKSAKKKKFSNTAQPRKIFPSKCLGYMVMK